MAKSFAVITVEGCSIINKLFNHCNKNVNVIPRDIINKVCSNTQKMSFFKDALIRCKLLTCPNAPDAYDIIIH